MQLSLKTLVAAVGLVLASASAMAQVVLPSQPAPGPTPQPVDEDGGLVFFAYDPVAGRSLAQYLGLTLSQVLPTDLNQQSLDFGVLSGWTTAFGSSTLSNIRWHVTAADNIGGGGPPDYSGGEFQDIQLATTAAAITELQNNALTNASTNVDEFISLRMNGAPGCNGVSPCIATSASAYTYAGLLENNLDGLTGGAAALPFTNTGGVGSALNFYVWSGSGTDPVGEPQDLALVEQYAGTWSLAANGQLQWQVAAAPVPLPAALWLLLSGMSGLFTIARRRGGAAVAA